MASNQTQGILVGIVGLILILLGLISYSNSSELVPTNACLLLTAGLIIFSGLLGGFDNSQEEE